MEPPPYHLICLLLAFASASSCLTSCEKLSTVFVLEPSDSDSSSNHSPPAAVSSSNHNSSNKESSNTRIITDNGPSLTTNNSKPQQQKPASQQSSNSSQRSPQLLTHQNQSHQDQTASRRIEEETQVIRQKVASTRSPNQSSSQKPKPTERDQGVSNNGHAGGNNDSLPKVEERLLISISSDEDEDHRHPPPPPPPLKHVGGGAHQGEHNFNYDDHPPGPPPHHHHQKRKPAITISIHDSIQDKQEGNSGPTGNPSVIVISTSGVGSSDPNKHNENNSGNKPSIAILTSSSNSNHNHNNGQPHRELEIPLSAILGGVSQRPSSTHKPSSLLSEFINNNRPIISALIDPPRLPSSLSEERPQRPVVGPPTEAGGYPEQRPPKSTSSQLNNSNNNNNNNNNNKPPPDSSGYGDGELSSSANSQSSKYPLNEKSCGLVHETRIVGGEEANPDDFLWMAAIVKSKPYDGEARPFCGGSLITRRHILTAAHCLENLAPRDVLVRLGSYDFDDSTASSLSADYAIDQFRVPALYSKKTHVGDIAIMRLKTPLSPQDNYKTVCMPQARRSYVGALATVTGYGSQSQTFRRATPKLRQVTVPIWENRKCSGVYKKNLTESFLCAGYEEGGKDACQGDSGGPLMTEGPGERMMMVGVVSHGIGCGSPGYPGVYTRVSTFLDWIEKNTKE